MAKLAAEAVDDRARLQRPRLPVRLPPLKPKWLPAYRAFWIAAFLLAMLMSAGGVYVRAAASEGLTTPFERAGLMLREQRGRLRVALTVREEAARLGIRPGDTLVAIAGKPVSDDPDAYDDIGVQLDGPPESKLPITVRSVDGRVQTHMITRSQRHLDQAFATAGLSRWLMRAADFTDVLTTMLLLAAAALLFRRRLSDPVAALLSLGLVLNLAGSGSAEYLILRIGGDVFFDALLSVGWMALLLAILTFPDGRLEPRWTLAAALLLPVSALVNYLDENSGTIADMAFMVAGVVAIAIRYRRTGPGDQRQQIRWALLGFAAGTFFLLVDQALLFAYRNAPSMTAALWSELLHYLAYAIAFACIPLGLLVSLLRYRLYDVDAAISRSAAYAVLTLLLSALFAGSMNGIEALIQASFGRDAGAEAAAVAAALTVLMVGPAHGRILNWAEARFQRALQHLRRDLPECVADLRETTPLLPLLDEIIGRVSEGVRAGRAAVLIGTEVTAVRGISAAETAAWQQEHPLTASEAALQADRCDPVFPVRLPLRTRHGDAGTIGWLLLGPRPDGSFYGKDEQEALAEIGDPIGRAVQIVIRREQLAREQAGRLAELEHGLADARATIARLERRLAPG